MGVNRIEHGGGLGDGRRKEARPVSTREPMYVVLRSSKAKGHLSLTRVEFALKIRTLVARQAEACRIEVLQFANEGQALHFLMRVPSRAAYLRFIRSVCGLISRQVTGSERGPASPAMRKTPGKISKKSRFWDVLPYSRIAAGCSTIRAAQRTVAEDVRKELGLLLSNSRSTPARSTQTRSDQIRTTQKRA
jgi:hypothetical protein